MKIKGQDIGAPICGDKDVPRIAGMTPLTTIDFPGKMAAVLFLRGCNLRCHYCHNAEMQDTTPQRGDISWMDVKSFLHERRNWLDGVVFSGGEPTIQKALPEAIRQVKAMGFEIALHTAGSAPERLRAVLPLVDWVGFDLKAPFEQYHSVAGVPGMGDKARRSLEYLLESGVDYEVRTTVDPASLTPDMVERAARQAAALGVTTYRLQEADRNVSAASAELESRLGALFGNFLIRRHPLAA